jgi:hypothetical protein
MVGISKGMQVLQLQTLVGLCRWHREEEPQNQVVLL